MGRGEGKVEGERAGVGKEGTGGGDARERGSGSGEEGAPANADTAVEIKPEPVDIVSYKFASRNSRDANSAIQDNEWPPWPQIDYSAVFPKHLDIEVDDMEMDPPVEEKGPEDVLQAADGEVVSTCFIA